MNPKTDTPNNPFYILTGGPGVGKTSVVRALEERGLGCIPEAARGIIKDQLLNDGDALPWKNRERYTRLMLERSVEDYEQAARRQDTVIFFDRGIPDTLAYARLERLAIPEELLHYSNTCRYNKTVFVFPPWEEIYTTDSERKQTFDEVVKTHEVMVRTYKDCGYHPLIVPRVPVRERVEFILSRVTTE